MVEGEGDKKKRKEKRVFCCEYENIYVVLEKEKRGGDEEDGIMWERGLGGVGWKDKNKNGIQERFFGKSFVERQNEEIFVGVWWG